ncbi:class I SAM-dependent methyltransferase, partial [candidate division KSB1 bacterium]|nr:class I SAM-dependent methyltransferase [candidate division KSB1 bacterium]
MKDQTQPLKDDGERIIPTKPGEISFVYARHKFAYQYAQNFVENKTVLDVGCGTGYGSKILSEKATYVHGIDYDSDAINYCKQHYSGSNIEFYQADATKFAGERKFDVAVCFQAIEHFEDIA